jgi:hypothetical protein
LAGPRELARWSVYVEAKHPDLIGKLTVSDILAMAEEV